MKEKDELIKEVKQLLKAITPYEKEQALMSSLSSAISRVKYELRKIEK